MTIKILIFAIPAIPTTAKPRPGAAAADLRLPPGVWRVLYAGLGHLISFFGSGQALFGSCERVLLSEPTVSLRIVILVRDFFYTRSLNQFQIRSKSNQSINASFARKERHVSTSDTLPCPNSTCSAGQRALKPSCAGCLLRGGGVPLRLADPVHDADGRLRQRRDPGTAASQTSWLL